ncbi:hypothetical protein HOLleu_27453 [Holothuria leucospilota]|uniref:Uncharacterized protein n=1 Tax=Holothuria leucospilota TaxID=206669 RepID=A0A9Q1BQL3_HOLLE|nr:hypothetical protein HOLleu_27453 [Holothuria leucospilota]
MVLSWHKSCAHVVWKDTVRTKPAAKGGGRNVIYPFGGTVVFMTQKFPNGCTGNMDSTLKRS